MRVTLLCMVISVVCTYEHWQLRRLVQSNPQALPMVLQQIGRTMPQLLEIINAVCATFSVDTLRREGCVAVHTHHCFAALSPCELCPVRVLLASVVCRTVTLSLRC